MRRRRRRVLAAPFVVTATTTLATTFAPGCDSQPIRNPPPPSWRDNGGGQWVYSNGTGDSEIWYKDGSCELRRPAECPPDATCNPPPPQPVGCPGGLPDGAKKQP